MDVMKTSAELAKATGRLKVSWEKAPNVERATLEITNKLMDLFKAQGHKKIEKSHVRAAVREWVEDIFFKSSTLFKGTNRSVSETLRTMVRRELDHAYNEEKESRPEAVARTPQYKAKSMSERLVLGLYALSNFITQAKPSEAPSVIGSATQAVACSALGTALGLGPVSTVACSVAAAQGSAHAIPLDSNGQEGLREELDIRPKADPNSCDKEDGSCGSEEKIPVQDVINAIQSRNPSKVYDLLKRGEIDGINRVDSSGYTALAWCVIKKDAMSFKLLLDHGANPNIKVPETQGANEESLTTYLHLAVEFGAEGIAKLLLAKHPSLAKAKDSNDRTPLELALWKFTQAKSQNGDLSGAGMVRLLEPSKGSRHYSQWENVKNTVPEDKWLSNEDRINAALARGDHHEIRQFLEPYSKISSETFAQMLKYSAHRYELYETLSSNEVDLSDCNAKDLADFFMSLPKSVKKKAGLLDPFTLNEQELLEYALENDEDILVIHLATRGIDLNAVDEKGNTLLMRALKLKSINVANQLSSLGVDQAHVNHNGESAVSIAIENYAGQLDKLNLRYGLANYNGKTPLFWAVQECKRDLVKELISIVSVENLDATDPHNGRTSLMQAVLLDQNLIAIDLINAGADPFKESDDRSDIRNALQAAVYRKNEVLLRAILEADEKGLSDEPDSEGNHIADIAFKQYEQEFSSENYAILMALKDYGIGKFEAISNKYLPRTLEEKITAKLRPIRHTDSQETLVKIKALFKPGMVVGGQLIHEIMGFKHDEIIKSIFKIFEELEIKVELNGLEQSALFRIIDVHEGDVEAIRRFFGHKGRVAQHLDWYLIHYSIVRDDMAMMDRCVQDHHIDPKQFASSIIEILEFCDFELIDHMLDKGYLDMEVVDVQGSNMALIAARRFPESYDLLIKLQKLGAKFDQANLNGETAEDILLKKMQEQGLMPKDVDRVEKAEEHGSDKGVLVDLVIFLMLYKVPIILVCLLVWSLNKTWQAERKLKKTQEELDFEGRAVEYLRTQIVNHMTRMVKESPIPKAVEYNKLIQRCEDLGIDTTEFELDDAFECPILGNVMADPIALNSGHVFDRDNLRKYEDTRRKTWNYAVNPLFHLNDPKTGETLPMIPLDQQGTRFGVFRGETRIYPLRKLIEKKCEEMIPKIEARIREHEKAAAVKIQRAYRAYRERQGVTKQG